MSWYNPLSWGQNDPEKYDYNSQQSKDARTFGAGGINHQLDIRAANAGWGAQSAGADLGNYGQTRGQQLSLADSLRTAMNGGGPSAAALASNTARNANQQNAAALVAGNRGRSSASGLRQALGSVALGNQGINAQEQAGRANEMAGARNALGGVLGQVGAQDVNVANMGQQNNQFNAGQFNNMSQFNANLQQNANLANQQTQYGIGTQELNARQHQGDMSFTNLDPGSPSYLSQLGPVAGALLNNAKNGLMMTAAHGAVVMPHYDSGGVIGIGQRRTPVSKGDLDSGKQFVAFLAGLYGGYKNQQQAYADQQKQQQSAEPMMGATTSNLGQLFPHADPANMPGAGPITSPSQLPMAMGKGGVVKGPQTALVGEAGPEAVIDLSQIVDRPTMTTLGPRGRNVVIPLSPQKQDDRQRVVDLALSLRKAMTGGR